MTKAQRVARRERWLIRLQALRFWLWCLVGVGIYLMLPGLKHGIQGIEVYFPKLLEIGVAMIVALLAVMLDDKLSTNKLITSKTVLQRRIRHALAVGLAAMGMIERVMG